MGEQLQRNTASKAKRVALALLLMGTAGVDTACSKESKPPVPIEDCSKTPLRVQQPNRAPVIEIKKQPDGSLAPQIPELVKVAMAGAMVEVEYGSGDNLVQGTGVMIKTDDGRELLVSAAHILARGGDATHVPNLNELHAIDRGGNKTGMKWAIKQFQMEGGAPVTPVSDPRRGVDVDLFIAEPTNPLGTAALPLVDPERGTWQAIGGYVPSKEDPNFLSGMRLFTGTTFYNFSGAVLTGLAGDKSFVGNRNSGGPTVNYQKKEFGVTGIITGHSALQHTTASIEQGFNVALPDGTPTPQIAITTPSTVVKEMLAICGPGVAPTPTP